MAAIMAYSVNKLHESAGALLHYMRETAMVLRKIPEDAPLRQTFRNDVHQLMSELEEVLGAMDDDTLAPAQRWRNWYRSLVDQDTKYGFKRANEVFHGSPAYTSKALAEADALGRWWFLEVAYEGCGEPIPFEYLGAREDSSDAERPSR